MTKIQKNVELRDFSLRFLGYFRINPVFVPFFIWMNTKKVLILPYKV